MAPNIAQLWGKAREKAGKGGDFVPVEIGKYIMQIVKAEANDYGGKRKIREQWCVIQSDNNDDVGKICNQFNQIDDEERLMWTQRQLMNLGVDLEAAQVKTEEDLMAIYEDLIKEMCAAHVNVTEKDGYVNMRVRKRVDEIDEDILVEPEEAIKAYEEAQKTQSRSGGSSSSTKAKEEPKSDEGGGEEDQAEVDIGDVVSFKKNGKAYKGKIVGYTDDEELKVQVDGQAKPMLVKGNDESLALVEKGAGEDAGEDKGDDGGDAKPVDFSKVKEGQAVEVDIDGDWYPGKISGKPDMKKKTVKVTFDEDGETESRAFDKIRLSGEPSGGEEDEREVQKGDDVLVTIRGQDKKAKVVKVDGDKADVKLENGKVIPVEVAKIKFES